MNLNEIFKVGGTVELSRLYSEWVVMKDLLAYSSFNYIAPNYITTNNYKGFCLT